MNALSMLELAGSDCVDRARSGRSPRTAPPLQRLWEIDAPADAPVRAATLPAELARRFDGQLAIPLHADRPTIVANFVSTIDGVVAFGRGVLSGGGLVSGFHEPDRFVMGLLRAMADVVVVGAGTLRGSTEHRWTPSHVHPASASAYRLWRERLGITTAQPTTMIVTASGDLPPRHAGLNDPTIPVVIATTERGAARLRTAGLADHVRVDPIGDDSVTPADLLALSDRLGARLVLSEGGPHLIADLVRADVLDELFLTVAPQLVGRSDPSRLGLLEGLALPPSAARWQQLVSVRRSSDHLFLRYRRLPPERAT